MRTLLLQTQLHALPADAGASTEGSISISQYSKCTNQPRHTFHQNVTVVSPHTLQIIQQPGPSQQT